MAAWCLLNYTPTFSANNESWFHYENDFFVAYSNAGEENVMNILRSLEQFRAAAFQIPSFVIPQGRPKTLVILPATHEEFLTYAYYETMAGFATVLARQPTIVLPASDPNLDLHVIVGHEFAHTLLFNDYFHYPSWYAEGFAEIASSIVIDPANNTFSIGARDDHRKKAAKSSIDWNDLTDSAFDAHALGDLGQTANAYAQDWLLVHFLTLNETTDHASELNRYFANINNGMPSQAAFPEAFGKTAAEFWQSDLQNYLDQIENRTLSFEPSLLDLDFQSTVATDKDLHPILNFLKDCTPLELPAKTDNHLLAFTSGTDVKDTTRPE